MENHVNKAALLILIGALAFCAMTSSQLSAQTLTTLVTFNGTNGILPAYGSLVQDKEGNLYGTTLSGGSVTAGCSNGNGFGCGTIFKISPSGTLTTLYEFCSQLNCADGITPYGTLVQGPNGNYYGVTNSGGANFSGTIFEITPDGILTTLYNFCSQASCADGYSPVAGLMLATNGNFYGTTSFGGAHNSGTIFQFTPAGELTTLYSFCSESNCSDGSNVQNALVQGPGNQFYGATISGGINGAGTIFAITPTGKFGTIHRFDYKDGAYPYGQLLLASGGNLVGTTLSGGARSDGTIFEISPAGKLKTLYNFCATAYCPDGAGPIAGLIFGPNGDFFGITDSGGKHFSGTYLRNNSFRQTDYSLQFLLRGQLR
jgi:uncharacterized repeat protein (TIGR03803 family)